MKKFILLLSLFLITATANVISAFTNSKNNVNVETFVYLCDSPSAYVYHSTKDCKGLSHCTHEIITVTLPDAINKYKRRACKICEK
jgi:hypothetical protein